MKKVVNPDLTSRPVFVLSDRHEGICLPWHSHRRRQLIHVSEGVLTVLTRTARFVVPPQRGVWIGPGIEHRITGRSAFWLTTCYLEPQSLSVPAASRVVAIDRLTNELLIAASEFGGDYPPLGAEARLIDVLLDRLAALEATDMYLPEPSDARLRKITARLVRHPHCNDSLSDLARDAALSERTAARLFAKETGLTFGRWRQSLKLQAALEHLGRGRTVTDAAFEVGYADVSSFIAAFKQAFGKTPSQILRV